MFNGTVGWLRERQVLLPAVTTLARLVARERDAATLRVWSELAQPVSGGQARLLRELLGLPEGSRRSELDRMRTPDFDRSSRRRAPPRWSTRRPS